MLSLGRPVGHTCDLNDRLTQMQNTGKTQIIRMFYVTSVNNTT